MKQLLPSVLLCLPACTLFGGLSEADQRQINEHRVRCEKYFNAHDFAKAIDQARRGLAIDPDDYALRSRLGWSHLELSGRTKADNIEHLQQALTIFGEIIEWRDNDAHESRTIFGYAKALHNQARIEHLRAKLLLAESKLPGKENAGLGALANEHTLRGKRYEGQSERYFLTLAEGDVAGRANRREAYEYLMVLKYRAKDFQKAIHYGKRNLELNDTETKFWTGEYKTTKLPGYEALAREELSRLGKSATAVHSSLAKYYRESQDFDQAISHLDAVIAARPRSYQEYYRRGICYRQKEDHSRARKDFQTFLQLSDLPETDRFFQDANEYVYGKRR